MPDLPLRDLLKEVPGNVKKVRLRKTTNGEYEVDWAPASAQRPACAEALAQSTSVNDLRNDLTGGSTQGSSGSWYKDL